MSYPLQSQDDSSFEEGTCNMHSQTWGDPDSMMIPHLWAADGSGEFLPPLAFGPELKEPTLDFGADIYGDNLHHLVHGAVTAENPTVEPLKPCPAGPARNASLPPLPELPEFPPAKIADASERPQSKSKVMPSNSVESHCWAQSKPYLKAIGFVQEQADLRRAV